MKRHLDRQTQGCRHKWQVISVSIRVSKTGAARLSTLRQPLSPACTPRTLCYMNPTNPSGVTRARLTIHQKVAMSSAIVTRFAPSPTGYLQYWRRAPPCSTGFMPAAMAARCRCASKTLTVKGQQKPPIAAILDGLTWLGLNWDGEAISQFERAPRHREVAEELVTLGQAYYCYCSPEELTAMRELATKKAVRRAMTAVGVTGTRVRHPKASSRSSASRRRARVKLS